MILSLLDLVIKCDTKNGSSKIATFTAADVHLRKSSTALKTAQSCSCTVRTALSTRLQSTTVLLLQLLLSQEEQLTPPSGKLKLFYTPHILHESYTRTPRTPQYGTWSVPKLSKMFSRVKVLSSHYDRFQAVDRRLLPFEGSQQSIWWTGAWLL